MQIRNTLSGGWGARNNIVAHQYPHEHINRNIAGDVDANTKTAPDLYLAKVVMKLEDQSA